jgi:hypothetical protein
MPHIETPILVALIGLVGALSVALINSRLTLWRDRRAAFRVAAQRFHDSILEVFQGLYPIPSNWPKDSVDIDGHLRAIFPKLQATVAQFRPLVPWYRRRAFDRAWLRYRSAYEREVDHQCYHHYIFETFSLGPKENFKKNVDALLSFAKRT